ncbi:helix-turn-helix transcriptional regulator [Pseudolactococcus plantarum]|uniref:DNA-binding protein n=1 Tax=Pseudolactococcus plantarum TaxID=1365 RepID=A0A2A5RVY5_9LACT|nr:helix-turn-helix transcriptional regulator [Lactococcus plantarum]MDN6071248.1 helix-turn-helix transcriptional regulator [Lactococcus plantarum]MDN6085290.1 helix-turn-helix transcriptional regulator [Lactococcus plantarum]PCS05382.1 DNA-binding protein [Lactococcus plantarum]HCN75535.1 transcriptional regulator [Lactococcus sp.]
MEKNKLILKNRLKVARAEKRLNQSNLAKLVGVSRQTISNIETYEYIPSAKLALLLCIALETTFEELFYFEDK